MACVRQQGQTYLPVHLHRQLLLGLLANLGFASACMSWRMRSRGARRKALTIVLSRANLSNSDDNTISVSLQVMQTLQRCFDRGGDDLTPFRGIHIAHRTSSQCSIEMANAMSQSCTCSGRGSSQLPQTEEGGGLEGDELEEELMFDVDADLVALDRARLGPGAQRH